MTLNVKQVETLKINRLHADGHSLYLQVTKGGAGKSWLYRYRAAGRTRDAGLGSAHVVFLADARKSAQALRMMRVEGLDPIEQRRAERHARMLKAANAVTFEDACAR